MSNMQKIRSIIASTQSTSKITNAMQLVAASKLGKNQARLMKARPYKQKMEEIIGHIAHSSSEYHHPFMRSQEEINRVGYIIISSNRGLCGSLNTLLFKKVIGELQNWDKKKVPADLCVIGNKALAFFKRLNNQLLAQATDLSDTPALTDLIGLVKVMLDHYKEGKINRVYIASNQFVSVMVQKPIIKQLLPIVPAPDMPDLGHWDYIYEPEAKNLLDVLLVRYIESQVYGSLIENIACEQAARMIAMQNATDNAKEIIDDLLLAYNKARQAKITQELAEIVGGAEAV